jgi:hypothetical protein
VNYRTTECIRAKYFNGMPTTTPSSSWCSLTSKRQKVVTGSVKESSHPLRSMSRKALWFGVSRYAKRRICCNYGAPQRNPMASLQRQMMLEHWRCMFSHMLHFTSHIPLRAWLMPRSKTQTLRHIATGYRSYWKTLLLLWSYLKVHFLHRLCL